MMEMRACSLILKIPERIDVSIIGIRSVRELEDLGSSSQALLTWIKRESETANHGETFWKRDIGDRHRPGEEPSDGVREKTVKRREKTEKTYGISSKPRIKLWKH
jgi:hypothetical protein